MNPLDSCLERLFRAAARAPDDLPAEAPFLLEAQLLSTWHASAPVATDCSVILAPLFRRAFLGACAIILVSVGLTFYAWRDTPPGELVIADSVIQLTLMP
jgi:hypothetical protein